MTTDTDIPKTDPVDAEPECPPRDERPPKEDEDELVAMRDANADDGGWTPPPTDDPPGG